MPERCPECPSPVGRPCIARSHGRYCQLVARESAYPPGQPRPYTESVREQSARLEPDPDDPAPGSLVLTGHGDSSTGYGRHTAAVARGLVELGVPLAFHPATRNESYVRLDPFLAGLAVDRLPGRPFFQMLDPHHEVTPGSVVLTVWETTRLPAGSVANLNRAACVVTPSRWNAEGFRASGVTVPTRIVPEGVDTAAYRPDESRPDPTLLGGPFTVKACFRSSGGGHRKGFGDVVAAFAAALGGRADCRLVIKVFPDCPVIDPGHPRVFLDRSVYDDAGLAAWYAGASVGLSMTRSEGWGLTLIEQMACGRPMVAPIHSGMAEYLSPENCYPVAHRAVPAVGVPYDGHGDWYEPDVASAAEGLRAAYGDRETRLAKGRRAAEDAGRFTWHRAGRELLAVLEEFGLACPRTSANTTANTRENTTTRERHAAQPRADVARETRLSLLRNRCPNGTKPNGCGCSDNLTCTKSGAAHTVSRKDCYACLEG